MSVKATECRKIDGSGKTHIPFEMRQELGVGHGDWVEWSIGEEQVNGHVERVFIGRPVRPVRPKRSGRV